MNAGKAIGLLVLVFILFWVLSNPAGAAGDTNVMLGGLREAADSFLVFLQRLLN